MLSRVIVLAMKILRFKRLPSYIEDYGVFKEIKYITTEKKGVLSGILIYSLEKSSKDMGEIIVEEYEEIYLLSDGSLLVTNKVCETIYRKHDVVSVISREISEDQGIKHLTIKFLINRLIDEMNRM